MRIKTIKAAKTARKSQRLGDILLIKSSPLIGASLQLVNKTDDNINIEIKLAFFINVPPFKKLMNVAWKNEDDQN